MAVRKLKLDVSLSRGYSSADGTHVTLDFTDHDSWSHIRLEMKPEQLGKLLSGEGLKGATVVFYNPQNLGKKRLRKSIKYVLKRRGQLPLGSDERTAFMQKIAAPYAKDGWIFAGPTDSWSQSDHGYDDKKEWVMLHFVKYVTKPKKVKEKNNG